ncbi:MAG: HAMP domain-containing sensor histidine kinase [Ilumatobacteraceae bacterium]
MVIPSLRDQPPPGDYRERVSDVFEGFVGSDGDLREFYRPTAGDYGAPDVRRRPPEVGGTYFTTGSTDGGSTYRAYAQAGSDGVLITAVPIDDLETTIDRLVLVEILGSLAILGALGLVGWWVLRLGIRPIKEMTESAERIADGDLTERVPEGSPGTEAGQLAGALNQMLTTIERSVEEQAASEARLRRFVADASHELRTPVTTIRGYAELYRHGGLADQERLDDAMRRTEQEAARMARLVEDMLTLAKLDEHRPLSFAPVDIAAIGRDAAHDARIVAPDRIIDVASSGDAVVSGDDDRIRQVVANVVGNAVVHTDPGTPIHITTAGDDQGVTLTVRDEGGGMPQDVADRVTERFFRADPSRTRHRGGSGLGLAIVDATVAAHGGTVTIDSQPDVGTAVSLWFPRVRPAVAATTP